MTTITRYVLAALVCGLVAGLVLVGGGLERRLAQAERELAVSDLSSAETAYAAVERQLSRATGVPWLLGDTRNEVIAKRAAIRYWQADYAGLVDEFGRVGDPMGRENVALQLTLANAAYRMGQVPGGSREDMLNALDRAIGRYLRIVQTSGGHVDAAFNYEFLIQLRDALTDGGDWTPHPLESPLGQEGEQPMDAETATDDVKIYVPMDHDNREEIDDPTMGGDPPIRRRG